MSLSAEVFTSPGNDQDLRADAPRRRARCFERPTGSQMPVLKNLFELVWERPTRHS